VKVTANFPVTDTAFFLPSGKRDTAQYDFIS